MSVVNSHLRWTELNDFTPGLYSEPNSSKLLSMPYNAAQQMDDCMPLPGGGIRAFYKPTAVSAAGIEPAPTNESVMGIGVRSGIAQRSGAAGDGTDRYMATYGGDKKVRLWRMDGSNAETTWKQKDSSYTFAAGAASSVRASQFTPFHDISNADWMLWVVRGGAAEGLYKIAYLDGAGPPAGDGVLTKLNTATGPMVVNQARIIIGDGGATKPYRLYYGAEGLTTGTITTLTAYLDLAPYQDGSGMTMLVPQEPGDLLVGREGAPWLAIQGDISSSSTPVREMGQNHTGGWTEQLPARTPSGVVYIEPGGRVYTTDGRNFENVSPTIERFYKIDGSLTDHVNVGKMAFLASYLFAPMGYIRDWETGAWFRTTYLSKASHWVADPYLSKVWGVNGGASFAMYDYQPFDRLASSDSGTGVNRNHTYTWRGSPLASPDGRFLSIREVQVFLRASAACRVVVTRTDADGTAVARTKYVTAAGTCMLSALFPGTGAEYQDITVAATQGTLSGTWTTDTTTEAPVIERIRIGCVDSHLSS